MKHPLPTRAAVAVLGVAALTLTACGAESTPTATEPLPSGSALDCSIANLPLHTAGTLTIGTDKPAYPPYFEDNDPTNGKGFESAVAYAVAENLGFTTDQVTWVTVPFNKSYAPGAKDFDFDINQISITPKRQETVDFSDGYYAVQQAVIAVDGTPGASATSIADLQALKLGAQVGTTSLVLHPGRREAHGGGIGLRRHQRGDAGAQERQHRRDRGRPADGVLHHGGGAGQRRHRRCVPRRAGR